MRTNLLLPVLSLFLLVPASITWAQITKTLNGTVRYESGMSKTTFTTPNGNVVVNLPQDMSGKVLTGTVSTVPAGKTEKEKNRNLKELLKMVVNLDGQKIPLSASPSNFDWLTHMDRPGRTPMELLNVSGAKLGEVNLPAVISPPAIIPGDVPHLSTPSNILIKGDALNIYTDQQFSSGEKFVVTDSKGHQFTLKPVCLSSQQAVVGLPNNIVPGECTATEEVWNSPAYSFNTQIHFKLADIQLSSPNTNLRQGQKSEVLALVIVTDSSGGWVSPDLEDILNTPLMTIDLRNLKPNTVTMEGGNLQGVKVQPDPKTGIAKIRRTITGNSVGTFSVSATLHEDNNTSNDPFRPQLNVLNTPEDFNAWVKTLKGDLKNYASVQGNDAIGQAIKANTQRAIDNMPANVNQDALEDGKAIVNFLLHPLNVPKGAAINFFSSYEAAKAASRAIDNNLSGNTELIDYDVIRNGTEFINRLATQLKDPSLQAQCASLDQLFDQINGVELTFSNLQGLKNNWNALVSTIDKKIRSDISNYFKYTLQDLIISSYQLPSLVPPGKVHPFNDLVGVLDPVKKVLNTTPEYRERILASLNGVPQADGSYKILSTTVTGKPISYSIRVLASPLPTAFDPDEWRVKYLTERTKANPKAGTVITVYKDSTGTWYRFFKDAECGTWGGGEPKEETTECSEIIEWIWKDDGTHEEKPTGKYHKITFPPLKQCKKGKDFCTEVYQVWRIEYIYEDKNCSVLRKVETEYEFGCK